MARQAEQRGVDIGFAPALGLSPAGQLVERGLEMQLALEHLLGIVERGGRW